MTPEDSPVYPIADGVVTYRSTGGWGAGNVGIVIKHKLSDGSEFLALYGHIKTTVNVGDSVVGGTEFAKIGYWEFGNHLHFGIHPGLTMPGTNWGMMPNSSWPDTNGFVDPIDWIETHQPATQPTAWAATYGGAYSEWVWSSQQSKDGGYIVIGDTNSGIVGYAIWVLKLDPGGDVQWQKIYDEGEFERIASIYSTSDGGYVVAAYTRPFDEPFGDIWVLKLDSGGTIQWSKTYGGIVWWNAAALSIQQTVDGGYIVAGGADFWVLKLDSDGNFQWQKTYGGYSSDTALSIQQTSDGGYIVAGSGLSYRGAGNYDYDYWILKLEPDGTVEWQKTYGEMLMSMSCPSSRPVMVGISWLAARFPLMLEVLISGYLSLIPMEMFSGRRHMGEVVRMTPVPSSKPSTVATSWLDTQNLSALEFLTPGY